MRNLDSEVCAFLHDDFVKILRKNSGGSGCVCTRVGNAEATAEVEFTQLDARLSREIGLQPQGTACRHLEAFCVEDL
jgi:hypothetical protein